MGFERDLFREAKLTKGQAPMRRHGPPGGGAEAVWRDRAGLSSPALLFLDAAWLIRLRVAAPPPQSLFETTGASRRPHAKRNSNAKAQARWGFCHATVSRTRAKERGRSRFRCTYRQNDASGRDRTQPP